MKRREEAEQLARCMAENERENDSSSVRSVEREASEGCSNGPGDHGSSRFSSDELEVYNDEEASDDDRSSDRFSGGEGEGEGVEEGEEDEDEDKECDEEGEEEQEDEGGSYDQERSEGCDDTSYNDDTSVADEDEAAYENQPAAGLSPRLVLKRAVETLQVVPPLSAHSLLVFPFVVVRFLGIRLYPSQN